eukprot:gb/GECG01000923.1/.p1 GENE.gb/GECG01000923.1/~~gb/GECG01000923.1/.p1  ORF type:complete len:494 (+),score=124.21 gb/GECG01000923.1/:1-1482(+)
MDSISGMMNQMSIASNGPDKQTPSSAGAALYTDENQTANSRTKVAHPYYDDRFDVDEEISLRYSRSKTHNAPSSAKQSTAPGTALSDLRSPLTPFSVNTTNVSTTQPLGESKSGEQLRHKTHTGKDSLYSALFAPNDLSVNDLNSNGKSQLPESTQEGGSSATQIWSGEQDEKWDIEASEGSFIVSENEPTPAQQEVETEAQPKLYTEDDLQTEREKAKSLAIEETRTEMQQHKNSLEETVNFLRQELEEKDSQLEAYSDERNNLKEELNSLGASKQNVDQQLNRQAEQIMTLNEDYLALQQRDAEKKQQVETLNQKMDELRGTLKSETQAAKEQATKEVEEKWEQAQDELREQYKALESRYDEKEKELEQALEKVQSTRQQYEETRKELDNYGKEVEDLKMNYAEQIEQNALLKDQLEEAERSTKEASEEQNTTLKNLEQREKQLKSELEAAQERIDALQHAKDKADEAVQAERQKKLKSLRKACRAIGIKC